MNNKIAMYKKSAFIYFCFLTILATQLSAQNSSLSFGLKAEVDFNFYKFSNGKFRDDERTNKASLGFTYGGLVDVAISKRFGVLAGFQYAKKIYRPERLFSFGILEEVQFKAWEVPVYLKYNFKQWEKGYHYFLLGMNYQIEKNLVYQYRDVSGEPFVPDERDYLVPALGYGLNYKLSKRFSARGEISYRLGRCHCEYLNPAIDKIGIAAILVADFGER